MTALYKLNGVERTFKSGDGVVRAVAGVDLEIPPGCLVAIEGPSGSGKSTMLQLLGALDQPTAGSLVFLGTDLGKLRERDRTRLRAETIGFVFQSFNLIPTLNAAENVEASLAPLKMGRDERDDRVQRALRQVGLGHRRHHAPSQLSGGEQQRVAIARALAKSPRVILADEPTGNLDTATSTEIVDLLAGLTTGAGVSVIIVTHSNEVARRADQRISMRDGVVLRPPVELVPAQLVELVETTSAGSE